MLSGGRGRGAAGCGPRAVAVTLVEVISSCRVGVRILCALDAVEILNKQAVRAAEGSKIGSCPSVRMVEFLGMAKPPVGRIELGKPSDETSCRVVEGRDTGCHTGRALHCGVSSSPAMWFARHGTSVPVALILTPAVAQVLDGGVRQAQVGAASQHLH